MNQLLYVIAGELDRIATILDTMADDQRIRTALQRIAAEVHRARQLSS